MDWVLHLLEELDDQLNKEIIAFEENQKMPYISSMERFGEKRGEKKGEAKMLTRMLQRRFGAVPDWANEKIAKAEPPLLEAWGLRFVDAQSLDDVFSDKV